MLTRLLNLIGSLSAGAGTKAYYGLLMNLKCLRVY